MKLAFIAPFYGADASGGAEAECRQTAHHLARAGHDVEIWTTCARDLVHGWTFNWHSEGLHQDGNIAVRRFRVNPHGLDEFNRLHGILNMGRSLAPEEEQRFFSLFCNAPDLYRHIDQHARDVDWMLFIPYLFGTTIYGSQIAPDKSILIPCLHDEAYAKTQAVNDLFTRCARTVFHSNAERELAKQHYPAMNSDHAHLIGEGVDQEFESDPDRFRARHNLHQPFILYAGRKDSSKNVDWLVDAFLAHKAQHEDDLQLVCIGPGALSIPGGQHPAIHDLGFVEKQDKHDAYDAAWLLCQPSLNESFSLVVMEAWSRGTPCLVHADCAVTREHCVRSGGGLYAATAPEFSACVRHLQSHPNLRANLGQMGKRYVRENFHWEHIVEKFKTEVLVQ